MLTSASANSSSYVSIPKMVFIANLQKDSLDSVGSAITFLQQTKKLRKSQTNQYSYTKSITTKMLGVNGHNALILVLKKINGLR